ncbi:LOW QUALITY PROTEIN: uncharacterized protein CFAP97D2 [Guaruba guarouba]
MVVVVPPQCLAIGSARTPPPRRCTGWTGEEETEKRLPCDGKAKGRASGGLGTHSYPAAANQQWTEAERSAQLSPPSRCQLPPSPRRHPLIGQRGSRPRRSLVRCRPGVPILPRGNKYLQLKWDKAKYEEYKKRTSTAIQTEKTLMDTSAPAIYSHRHLKLGKDEGTLEEDRLSVIKRDMHLLLEKMSFIMRTKRQIDNKNYYKAAAAVLFVCSYQITFPVTNIAKDKLLCEDTNFKRQAKTDCSSSPKVPPDSKMQLGSKRPSSNGEKRRLELQRVNQENCAILDRITKSQPQYRVQRWHEDWQAEKHMANTARYPHAWYKSQSRKEEQFKNQTPEQDRKREKQLNQEDVKSKMKEKERDNVHHGKGKNN